MDLTTLYGRRTEWRDLVILQVMCLMAILLSSRVLFL